jgi:drug/metabolite transporter (DMT)-like permease
VKTGTKAAVPERTPRAQAVIWLVVACVFWGLSFPLGKALGELHARLVPGVNSGVVALGILAPRFLLGSLVLVLALRPRWRDITRAEWRLGLGLAAFSGGGVWLQFEAMQHTHATTSAFLTQFYVVLIPLFLAMQARRWPPLRVVVAVALVLAGVAVLARLDWRDLHLGRGEAGTLAATVFFSAQILWLGRKEFTDTRAGITTLLMFAGQGFLFGALALVSAPAAETFGPLVMNGAWWGLIGLLTAFCTLGAFLLMNHWQPKIGATEAGLVYCAEPLFATVLAAFLPAVFSVWAGINYANEPLSAAVLLGGGLITAANLWLHLVPEKKG